MIRSVELKNWKTHKDTSIEFSSGTNILIGQMGSGKSSLTDAICFALFGTYPAMQRRHVSISRVIRNRPSQEKVGHVRLSMDIDGSSYAITRTFGVRGKPEAVIEKDGKYLQSQPERVTEEVERILKVDYETFSRVIYSEQNQLEYFLDLRSAERKKQIDCLLGLDKFANAQENATTLANRIKDMISENERISKEFDIPKVKGELAAIEASLLESKKEYEQASSMLKGKLEERARLEESIKSLKSMQAKKAALAREIEGLRGRKNFAESEVSKAKSLGLPSKAAAYAAKAAAGEAINSLKKAELEAEENERRLYSRLAKLEATVSEAGKRMKEKSELEKNLAKIDPAATSKQISECSASIDRISTELSGEKSAASEAAKHIAELSMGINRCPVCERELDSSSVAALLASKKKSFAEHDANALRLSEDLIRSRERLKELNLALNSAEVMLGKIKSYEGVESLLTESARELEKAVRERDLAKAKRQKAANDLQAKADELQKLSLQAEAAARADEYSLELSRISQSISQKMSDYEAINVDDKQVDSAQEAISSINSEIGKLDATVKSSSKYVAEKGAEAARKSAEISRIEAIFGDIEKKKAVVQNLSKFKLALTETQATLRMHLIDSINIIMQEAWEALYPYGDYSGIMLDASEEDYALKVRSTIDGRQEWEEVQSIASGGERSTACLAMRIAFSLVLVPNLKWLILDEPTHNIDQQGISRLVHIFGETLPGIIDQTFIITHEDMMKQVSGARIYLFSRNKEEHKATEVSEA